MANITAKDIAEKLGISTASVSVALNGKPGVSQATREKILAVAASMGYSLPKASSGDSRLVCFLLYADPAVAVAQESSFSTFVLKGVEDTAKELERLQKQEEKAQEQMADYQDAFQKKGKGGEGGDPVNGEE